MTSIGIYWRTLRHLRFTQIAYQLYYRLVPARPARRLDGLQPRSGLPALAFAAPVVPEGPGRSRDRRQACRLMKRAR